MATKPRYFATPTAFRTWLETHHATTAHAWFTQQAPWYQRAAHWVISAKQETTRDRRLGELIRDSAAGRRIKPLAATKAKRRSR